MVSASQTSMPVDTEFYENAIREVCGEVAAAMESKTVSIPSRVSRATKVYNTLLKYSQESRAEIFRTGQTPRYNAPKRMHEEFKAAVISFFDGVYKELGLTDKATATMFHEVWKTLQRLISEATVSFQYLDMHLRLSGTGVNVRQECLDSVSSGWSDAVKKQCLKESLRMASLDRDGKGGSMTMEAAKSGFDLLLALKPPNQRPAFHESYVNDYITQLIKELQNFKIGDNVQQYVSIVSQMIDAEKERLQFTVGAAPDSTRKLKEAMQKELIEARVDRIVNDKNGGVLSTVAYPEFKPKELKELYNVLDYKPKCIAAMCAATKQGVTQAMTSRPFDLKRIIDIRAQYTKLIIAAIPTTNSLDFHMAVQDGLASGLPTDGTFENALCKAINAILQERSKKPNDVELQSQQQAIFDTLSIVPNVDLFITVYKESLAKRLLVKANAYEPVERQAYQLLTLPYGPRQTFTIKQILDDYHAGNGKKKGTTVANAFAWPKGLVSHGTPTPNCGSTVAKQVDAELQGLRKKDPKRSFWVEPYYSTAEVSFKPPPATPADDGSPAPAPCQVTLSGNLLQLAVLLCYDQPTAKLSKKEITTKAKMSSEDLSNTLPTLLQAQVLIPDQNETFTINLQHLQRTTGKMKIVLPTMSGR